MKKALAILISIFLLFSFIACSSEIPEPPAVETEQETELDKANDVVTSLDDILASIEGTEITEPVYDPVNDITITSASKTETQDESTGATVVTTEMEYEDASGVVYSLKNTESEILTINDEVVTEADAMEVNEALDVAKAFPASRFTKTAGDNGEEIYTYTPSEDVRARAVVQDSNISRIVVTFIYSDNGVSYSYEVTYIIDNESKTVKQEISKTTEIERNGEPVDVSEDLKNEFNWNSVQNGENRTEVLDALRILNSFGLGFDSYESTSGSLSVKDNSGDTFAEFSLLSGNDAVQRVRVDFIDSSLGLPYIESGSMIESYYEEQLVSSDDGTVYHNDTTETIIKNKSGRTVLRIVTSDENGPDIEKTEMRIEDASSGKVIFGYSTETVSGDKGNWEAGYQYTDESTTTLTLPDGMEFPLGTITIKNGSEIVQKDTYVVIEIDDTLTSQLSKSDISIDGVAIEINSEFIGSIMESLPDDSLIGNIIRLANGGFYITMNSSAEYHYKNGAFVYYDQATGKEVSVRAQLSEEMTMIFSVEEGILDRIQEIIDVISSMEDDGFMDIIIDQFASGTIESSYTFKFPDSFYGASRITYNEISPMVGDRRFEVTVADGYLSGTYSYIESDLYPESSWY